MVARALLDLDEPRLAFEVCDQTGPARCVRGSGRRRLPRRLDRLALPRRRAFGREALCARRRGRRESAVHRPRRLLAGPSRRGDGRCRRGQDGSTSAPRASRSPITASSPRSVSARPVSRFARRRRRRGRSARRGGPRGRGALCRRARRSRSGARLRRRPAMARRGAARRDGRGGEAAGRHAGPRFNSPRSPSCAAIRSTRWRFRPRACRPSCRLPAPPTCPPSTRSRGRKANSSGMRRRAPARRGSCRCCRRPRP